MFDKDPEPNQLPQVKYRSLIDHRDVDNSSKSIIRKRQFPMNVVTTDTVNNNNNITPIAEFSPVNCKMSISGRTPFGDGDIHKTTASHYSKQASKSTPTGEPAVLDQAICNFLTKFGLSSDTVRDVTFMKMILSVGKERSLPNPKAVEIIVKKNAEQLRKTYSFETNKPTALTIDFMKQKEAFFLAFSIHFYNDENVRKSSVFLRKLASLDASTFEIMTEIRKVLKNEVPRNIVFTNIVTTNSLREKAFYSTGSVENRSRTSHRNSAHTYVCYFSYISNFAEAVIRINRFQVAIDKLKKFFDQVKSTTGMYSRLEKYLGGCFDLPESDFGKWLGTATFLEQTLHLHEKLKSFGTKNNVCYALDDVDHGKLMFFQHILSQMKTSVKKLSKPDSLMSLVVPEIIELKSCISRCADPGTKIELDNHFKLFLAPLISNYRGGCYSYATILDPRIAFDENILSAEEWKKISNLLKTDLVESRIVEHLLNSFILIVEQQLEEYEHLVSISRPALSSNPFDWWNENILKFSCLFDRALKVLSPPPSAIDCEYYFGKRGKFNHLSGKMEFKRFNEWLEVAGSQETFRGRGCPENEQLQLEPVSFAFQMPEQNLYKNDKKRGGIVGLMCEDDIKTENNTGYEDLLYSAFNDFPSTSSDNLFMNEDYLLNEASTAFLLDDNPSHFLGSQTLETLLMNQPVQREEILVTCGGYGLEDEALKEVKKEVGEE